MFREYSPCGPETPKITAPTRVLVFTKCRCPGRERLRAASEKQPMRRYEFSNRQWKRLEHFLSILTPLLDHLERFFSRMANLAGDVREGPCSSRKRRILSPDFASKRP